MKIVLDLRSKPSRLVFTNYSHDYVVSIIVELMSKYNSKLGDQRCRLTYTYIPGPLNLLGQEESLRHFCTVNDLEISGTERSYPPMPPR
jgi:hypothetical protein